MSPEIAAELAALRAKGLTFADCVEAWAASDDDPYVAWAREHKHRDGELEIDDHAVISDSDAGNYVMAWVWVGDDDLKP